MTIEEFLAYAQKQKIKLQITIFQENSLDINILNGQQRKHILSEETSYEIKANINKKYVKLQTNYLSEELISLLIENSKNIESNYEDSFINESTKSKITLAKKIRPFNPQQLLVLSSLIDKPSYITNIELNYSASNSSKRIVNTNGLDISTPKNLIIFNVQVTANYQNNLFTVDDIIYATKENINFEELIKKVLTKIDITIHQSKLPSAKYNVILAPTFTSSLLKEFITLLSKEEIRKKTSCLENKLLAQLFSKKLTIIEDPNNKKYPGYTKFDDEGTKTTKKTIIKNGLLQTYLYNNKEAFLENKKSTGNSYSSGISARNLYIKEGTTPIDSLLKELNNGLYINNYLETGGVTLNPTTGKISVQIFGYFVENGQLTKSFEPCILTTTIFELFSNIKDLGDTLEFKTFLTAAPHILVENMSISSN